MEQEIVQVETEKVEKKQNFFLKRILKYQVITFTFGFLLLNQVVVFWVTCLTGEDSFLGKLSLKILFAAIGIPLIYFLQWLLVVWIASKFPREKLKEKFLRHPVATIILFVLYITDLPYRLSEYWGGNIASIFEVIVYYAFISFLWWLLICWISDKIFKKQRFQWNWYRKIVDKIFVFIPPVYKFILGLIVALFVFLILFLLITIVFHYSGADLKNLFKATSKNSGNAACHCERSEAIYIIKRKTEIASSFHSSQ